MRLLGCGTSSDPGQHPLVFKGRIRNRLWLPRSFAPFEILAEGSEKMSPTTAVVQSVLKADGTLELDEKPWNRGEFK